MFHNILNSFCPLYDDFNSCDHCNNLHFYNLGEEEEKEEEDNNNNAHLLRNLRLYTH